MSYALTAYEQVALHGPPRQIETGETVRDFLGYELRFLFDFKTDTERLFKRALERTKKQCKLPCNAVNAIETNVNGLTAKLEYGRIPSTWGRSKWGWQVVSEFSTEKEKASEVRA